MAQPAPRASFVSRLVSHEGFAGGLMMLAAALALIAANTGLAPYYHAGLETKLSVLIGETGISKPLVLWINDGLMAVFFFLIGLELKREMVEGRLKNPRDVMLPGIAALGGMLAPMAVYLTLTRSDPALASGWAIPAATDIAFAVGVLALVGKGLPPALKTFLLTLAILDDMGAILIIALFYGHGMNAEYLLLALIPLAGLFALNRFGAHRVAPYVLLGVILWVFVLKSGVHATVAGVITAFFLPIKDRVGASPLHAVEHNLHPYVMLLIAPVFAFANAGVDLSGLSVADLFAPLPLGIALGLFIGKQAGVFLATRGAVALGVASLPHGTTWLQVYGLSLLAGIGFTMSLFIGALSFSGAEEMNAVRMGVLLGSGLSAVAGYLVLRVARPVANA